MEATKETKDYAALTEVVVRDHYNPEKSGPRKGGRRGMNMLWIGVVGLALCLAGCGVKDDSASDQPKEKCFMRTANSYIIAIEIEGHEYIVAYRSGIVHSESCPCRKGDAK